MIEKIQTKRFHIFHSIIAITSLIILEGLVGVVLKNQLLDQYGIIFVALFGGMGIIAIAVEAIEEIKQKQRMLLFLSAVVFEFIVFFAFEYCYFSLILPGAFQGLTLDPVTLLLHSAMVFAFNPLYAASTVSARLLMLINTLESMALALFVLQNVWQFRGKEGNVL